MKRPVFVSPQEAASMIESNSTVATIGMTLVSASESILKAIEQRYLEEKAPNGLTLVHSCGQSDRDRGIQHFAHEGMLKRIIGGHWGLQPKMMELISENKILAYCIPQGQFAQLYRSMAGGEPGKITKVGLGKMCIRDRVKAVWKPLVVIFLVCLAFALGLTLMG